MRRVVPTDDRDAAGRPEGVLAVDVGATKLAVAIVLLDGTVVVSDRVATPARDPWSALAGLVGRVLAAASDVEVVGCGVGCGGPMEPGGTTVSPLHLPAWCRFPLAEALGEIVHVPITIDNDAKAFALGEGWRGRAVGRSDFVAVVIGTGVGAGIVLDGRLLDGESANAGHVGHVVVEPDGVECRCGAFGCLDAYLAGSAILRETGRDARYAGEMVRERNARLLGRALASVAALTSVDLVVIGGGIGIGWGEPFRSRVADEFRERSRLSFTNAIDIVLADPTDRSPLLGAAALALGRRVVAT